VYERYAGCLDATGQHGAMSVTKSLTGLLGEMLVAEGVIDDSARVDTIVPELQECFWRRYRSRGPGYDDRASVQRGL
jgi:CubicO group peptidase (beta-lactamase class C family)